MAAKNRKQLRDVSKVPLTLELSLRNHSGKWSGRRESNPYYQLGKVNTAPFIFNTYKNVQEKYACMHCIPCMRCLICVLPGDVLGDVFYHALLFATEDLRLTLPCPKHPDTWGPRFKCPNVNVGWRAYKTKDQNKTSKPPLKNRW